MPLCDHCTVLPAAWLVPRFYDLRDSKYPAHNEPMHWMHQPSWSALEVSAASCDLCALILREYVDDCEKLDPPNCQPEIRFELVFRLLAHDDAIEPILSAGKGKGEIGNALTPKGDGGAL